MSNKYSFAMVVDQHERQGINELTDSYHVKRRASKPQTSRGSHPTDSAFQTSPTASRPRIRLQSSDELPRASLPKTSDQAGEENTSYLRQACPWHEEAISQTKELNQSEKPYLVLEGPIPTPPWLRKDQDSYFEAEHRQDSHIFPNTDEDPRVRPSSRSTDRKSDHKSDRASFSRHHRRKGTAETHATEDTAIWDPRPSSSRAQNGPAMTLLPVKKAPQPPLTPPLTPKVGSRSSQEIYSPEPPESMPPVLEQSFEDFGIGPTTSSSHHSSSRSKSSLSRPSTDTRAASRPQTQLSYSTTSPTPPLRRSSLHAPTSPESTRRSPNSKKTSPVLRPLPTSPHFSITSRRSLDSLDLEADLTPLPPDLTTDPEFLESFPWTREGHLPGVSRILRHEAPNGVKDSTIPRESFDSAAPPPIALSKLHEGVRKPRGAPYNPNKRTGNGTPGPTHKHIDNNSSSSQTMKAYSCSNSSSQSSGGSKGRKLTKQNPDPSALNSTSHSRPASSSAFRSLQRAGYPPPTNSIDKSREGLSNSHSMNTSNRSTHSGSSSGSIISGAHAAPNGVQPSLTRSRSKHLLSGVFPSKWGRPDSAIGEAGSVNGARSAAHGQHIGGVADRRIRNSDAVGAAAREQEDGSHDGFGVKSYRPSRPELGVRHPSMTKKLVNIGGKSYVPEELYHEDELGGVDGY